MQSETLSKSSVTEELFQQTAVEDMNQFEINTRDNTDQERFKLLLEADGRIRMVQELLKNARQENLHLQENYGKDVRAHLILNDRDQDIAIRITSEGYIDILTMVDPTEIEIPNSTDSAKVKAYAEKMQEEEPPIVTVAKRKDGYKILPVAEDDYSGGTHRTKANRYIGNEKMWVFSRLTDSEGYVMKLFRDDYRKPEELEKKLKEFAES